MLGGLGESITEEETGLLIELADTFALNKILEELFFTNFEFKLE